MLRDATLGRHLLVPPPNGWDSATCPRVNPPTPEFLICLLLPPHDLGSSRLLSQIKQNGMSRDLVEIVVCPMTHPTLGNVTQIF